MKITEALAEIKTIEKRLAKKREFVLERLFLQGHMKDPLANEGGTRKRISEERQSIAALEDRVVELRLAINRANNEHRLEVGGVSRTIAEWLVWRRECSSRVGNFLTQMNNQLQGIRRQLQEKNIQLADRAETAGQVEVFVSESDLMSEIDRHEQIVGELDGKLSLANATIEV